MVDSRLLYLKKMKGNIIKAHGDKMLGSVRDIHLDLPRISTGSLSLDFGLGGGVSVGRCTLLRGPESSGKTYTAYMIAAEAQNLCANCLRRVSDLRVEERIDSGTGECEKYAIATCDCYNKGIFKPIQYKDEKKEEYKERLKGYEDNSYEEFRVALVDIEGGMDQEWASCIGVDLERMLYMRPDNAETAIDIYDELLRTGAVDLIILDSIALMSPSEEIENSAVKQQQGLQARLMGKFTRKLAATISSASREFGRLPTQVWINQEREKIGIMFGDNTVLPAGKAQLFYVSAIIKFWSSKWEKDNFNEGMIAEHEMSIGRRVRINFKLIKNKTGPSQTTGSYLLNVSGENKGKIDEVKFVVAQAERFGLYRVEKDGAKKKYWVGDEEYKTAKAAQERMTEPFTFAELKKMILEKMLGAR